MGSKDQLITDEAQGPAGTTWYRAASGHVGLFAALIIYTALGGLVFRELEYPGEVARLEALAGQVRQERRELLARLSNSSGAPHDRLLADYEAAVQEAAKAGLLVPLSHQTVTPAKLARWSHLQAVFFASTVLTTIGYGNITPYTVEGRLFCMVFALVGIPLTLSVLADLGTLLAGTLPTLPEAPRATAALAMAILLVYIGAGSLLFITWEPDWTFFDGFYFCFVTMTTIGFGDLVPSTPQYMLLSALYTLVGLSLTSTIIEVLRQQYSQSWRHLQALAEALGQLAAEHHPADPRHLPVLTRGTRAKDWERAVHRLTREMARQKGRPKLVQVIVYESSV